MFYTPSETLKKRWKISASVNATATAAPPSQSEGENR